MIIILILGLVYKPKVLIALVREQPANQLGSHKEQWPVERLHGRSELEHFVGLSSSERTGEAFCHIAPSLTPSAEVPATLLSKPIETPALCWWCCSTCCSWFPSCLSPVLEFWAWRKLLCGLQRPRWRLRLLAGRYKEKSRKKTHHEGLRRTSEVGWTLTI